MRTATSVTTLAADVLEVLRRRRDRIAAGLLETDHVTADAIRLRSGRVPDQRVEGAGVLREQPGRRLRLVADAAGFAAAVAGRVQQHRHRLAGELGEPHAHQRRVAVVAPALHANHYAALRVDHEDVGDAGHDAVGGAQREVVVDDDREEVEAIALQLRLHGARGSRDRDSDQRRARGFWKLRQLVLQECERVMAVRAGVEEEDQDDGLAAQRREIDAPTAFETLGGECRAPASACRASARARSGRQPAAAAIRGAASRPRRRRPARRRVRRLRVRTRRSHLRRRRSARQVRGAARARRRCPSRRPRSGNRAGAASRNRARPIRPGRARRRRSRSCWQRSRGRRGRPRRPRARPPRRRD